MIKDAEIEVLMRAIGSAVRDYFAKQSEPREARIATLETKLQAADQIVATLGDSLRMLEDERRRMAECIEGMETLLRERA